MTRQAYFPKRKEFNMSSNRIWVSLVVIVSCAAVPGVRSVAAWSRAQASQQKSPQARLAYSHDLPPMSGGSLAVTIVEVDFGPGESSMPHSHPCPVIGYVVEGTLRNQVKGEPEAVYKAGESFYEPPNGVHLVAANASDTQPAKLLAYFVCDHKAALSVPAPQNMPAGDK